MSAKTLDATVVWKHTKTWKIRRFKSRFSHIIKHRMENVWEKNYSIHSVRYIWTNLHQQQPLRKQTDWHENDARYSTTKQLESHFKRKNCITTLIAISTSIPVQGPITVRVWTWLLIFLRTVCTKCVGAQGCWKNGMTNWTPVALTQDRHTFIGCIQTKND